MTHAPLKSKLIAIKNKNAYIRIKTKNEFEKVINELEKINLNWIDFTYIKDFNVYDYIDVSKTFFLRLTPCGVSWAFNITNEKKEKMTIFDFDNLEFEA